MRISIRGFMRNHGSHEIVNMELDKCNVHIGADMLTIRSFPVKVRASGDSEYVLTQEFLLSELVLLLVRVLRRVVGERFQSKSLAEGY